MGYVIVVKGVNGKKFYVKKLRKRIAETTPYLHEAIVFHSVQQLRYEYKNSQGENFELEYYENYITPYVMKIGG